MFFLFFLVFFFYFILFSSCVNKSYCICSLKFGICHICIQKTASLSFKNYDPPCHYNKGQVTLMCQQLSDYVVGSYTKCVNKRRYTWRNTCTHWSHSMQSPFCQDGKNSGLLWNVCAFNEERLHEDIAKPCDRSERRKGRY